MVTGLLDTSVVMHWHDPRVAAALPEQVAISAITAAELAAGPHLTADGREAAARQARLQEVESTLEPVPSTPQLSAATDWLSPRWSEEAARRDVGSRTS